jgi:glycosyltransferase involved in cell wall biosynthesis
MIFSAMLRVKNESRWIGQVIASIRPLCSEILVFDDHSDDGTPVICRDLGATVFESPFDGLQEARDKNWLLERVRERKPDWVLCIDGDEVLEPGGAEFLRKICETGGFTWASLRVLYLWDRPDQMRIDGVYGRYRRPSLFRMMPDAKFVSANKRGFHCGNAPMPLTGICRELDLALLHYGYMNAEDRLRKYFWYNDPERDALNDAEDNYRHMVQGDLPEFPAEATFKHAGPLQLENLCSHLTAA